MRNWIKLFENYSRPEYIYSTNCVSPDVGDRETHGSAIEMMCDESSEISYDKFLNYVGIDQCKNIFDAYDWSEYDDMDEGGSNRTLTMKNDYAMQEAYYKSKWYGIDCIYCVHSAIEYVFTKNGKSPEDIGINRKEFVSNYGELDEGQHMPLNEINKSDISPKDYETLETIAKKYLSVETLSMRNSDKLDYYDCNVNQIKRALIDAFLSGKSSS